MQVLLGNTRNGDVGALTRKCICVLVGSPSLAAHCGMQCHVGMPQIQSCARAPPPPAGPLPDVGPILVVCFTNHALDAFLEDVIKSGATESIVRAVSAPWALLASACTFAIALNWLW